LAESRDCRPANVYIFISQFFDQFFYLFIRDFRCLLHSPLSFCRYLFDHGYFCFFFTHLLDFLIEVSDRLADIGIFFFRMHHL